MKPARSLTDDIPSGVEIDVPRCALNKQKWNPGNGRNFWDWPLLSRVRPKRHRERHQRGSQSAAASRPNKVVRGSCVVKSPLVN